MLEREKSMVIIVIVVILFILYKIGKNSENKEQNEKTQSQSHITSTQEKLQTEITTNQVTQDIRDDETGINDLEYHILLLFHAKYYYYEILSEIKKYLRILHYHMKKKGYKWCIL